jgi:pimeloyl-ACP methyl ester carboxylesterase
LTRIGSYLGQPATFSSLDEAADALWSISQGFGPHTREQWLDLTRAQIKTDGRGGWIPHYDPAIAVPFKAVSPELWAAAETLLWQTYDQLRLPTLLLRGAESDLLSSQTAMAMTQRGPRARMVEFAGVGHAPMLVQEDQRLAVREFLLAP